MDRRNFLKLLGITSGTAVVSSCGVDKANEKIIPYVIPPEEEVYRGKALYYNTTCSECPANCGLEVKVNEKVYHEMRSLFPTKLEGIERHPINDGALCARGQAGLFRLYHPDRVKRPMMRDEGGNLRVVTWKEAFKRIQDQLQKAASAGKKNLYFSGRTTGTLSELIDEFGSKMKVERQPEFETFSHANIRQANQLVFDRSEIPHYQIDKADFLLTLGSDLFESFVSPVQYAVQFGEAVKHKHFNWYHIEPHVSLTGVQASERLHIKPKSEPILLAFLIHAIIKQNKNKNDLPDNILNRIPEFSVREVVDRTGLSEEKIRMMTTEMANANQPLVISGGVGTAHEYGMSVAVMTALLQWILGTNNEVWNFSQAENYQNVGNIKDVERILARLNDNAVGVFFISRTDPVSMLPQTFQFEEKIKKAGLLVGISDTMTATVKECDVILPLSHTLESWGDTTPRQGLRTIIQPAIEPQYDTLTEGDILLQLMNSAENNGEAYKDYLFRKWNQLYGESAVTEMKKRGYHQAPVSEGQVSLNTSSIADFLRNTKLPNSLNEPVLVITPSIRKFDGRSKDLPLLTEIPDPLTTISYGEWISVSSETAVDLGLKDGDEIEISAKQTTIIAPVKIQPLLPSNVYSVERDLISVPETQIEPQSAEASWYLENISVSKTGKKVSIPVLAGSMEEGDRGILPHQEEHGHGHGGEEREWYPEHEHENYRWGMTIDLESCIGCNACSAACYVENNIPIVGREEHLKGREMSWIRMQPFIDKNKFVEFVPMLCQHCDDAPCEPVCPVYAAYHNPEGLNVQVYNRCVGTRYCSNNCPYKVRRFNWFDHRLPEPWDKMYNPDVSVRDRGIMEKCTFCIQRIRDAKDHAKDEGRLVQDGEITPACAQTCPTNAITFGDIEDKKSGVYQKAHSDRAYRALEELGTEPAVHYLQKKNGKHEV